MKYIACFILLFTVAMASAQTAIGIKAGYGRGPAENYYIDRSFTTGVYFNMPVWKKLEFNAGINLVNGTANIPYFDYWGNGLPFGTSKSIYKNGILELPVEFLLGLYQRPEAIMKAYFHLGYSIGKTIYAREYYYNRDSKILGTKNYGAGGPFYHNINFELEFRWMIAKKFPTSFFVSAQATTFAAHNRQMWNGFVGTGLRFGFILPKKAK